MSAPQMLLDGGSEPTETAGGGAAVLMDARSYRVAQIMVRTLSEAAVQDSAATMTRADAVVAFYHATLAEQPDFSPDVEGFWVLLLNRKNRLMMWQKVTSGTATAALAHPREVFRAACCASASAVVCLHNHPSGDPAPSGPDVQVTHLLREAAKVLDVSLLDHVIVGRPGADPLGRGYYSFREAGLI